MSAAEDQALREARARVEARTAMLTVEHDDWSLQFCYRLALLEELFVYGSGRTSVVPPVGILGCSPLKSLKDSLK